MGSSKFSAEFVFEQNEYYVGETARVKVIVDNSKCKCDIKNLKFKLHRTFKCKTNQDVPATSSEGEYISEFKFAGCNAGETMERDLEL